MQKEKMRGKRRIACDSDDVSEESFWLCGFRLNSIMLQCVILFEAIDKAPRFLS